ncbi:DUF551 domain-containing protein [Serratia sarumanii]|uniref:DUF551 domain-containing protein n=1 Tax=Serratia sarumanii TaxID=3020826 RepID=UPI003F7CD4DD
MTLTTEQLRARANFWREKAVEAKWESVSIAQDMLLNAEAFDELAANREAQPVAWRYSSRNGDVTLSSIKPILAPGADVAQPLYTAPPAPAVRDGYCVMPLTLTAENGAKGALSGEFKVSRTVRCHECGGEGCDDCGDAGELEEETIVPWDTIKDIYRTAVDACRAEMLAQPVSQRYKLNSPVIPDGWVSCEDRMPEEGDVVLVCQEGGIIYCAEMQDGELYPDEFPRVPSEGREITHWMPLPAAPEGGNDHDTRR